MGISLILQWGAVHQMGNICVRASLCAVPFQIKLIKQKALRQSEGHPGKKRKTLLTPCSQPATKMLKF